MDLENQEIDNLLAEIINVLNTQLNGEKSAQLNNSPKQNELGEFRSVQMINEANVISKSEAFLLRNAALTREEALVDLRKNKIETGKLKLHKVSEMPPQNGLSREAFLILKPLNNPDAIGKILI